MYGLSTKAQRLQAREAALNAAKERGAVVSVHPEADCVSVLEVSGHGGLVQIYHGSAATLAENTLYRDPAKAREALEKHVAARARYLGQKTAQNAKGRTLSASAQTAAAIRKELARLFPGVKFSVHSDNFSMGDSVDVRWSDGPIQSIVDHILRGYEWGTFDAMTDSSGSRELSPDIGCPGARFVQSERTLSATRTADIVTAATEAYGELPAEQYSVYNSGHFEARLYEAKHPELWPEEYRAIYAQQQEEQRLASIARAEENRREFEEREAKRAASVVAPKDVPPAIEHAARLFGILEAYRQQMDDTMLELYALELAQAWDVLPGEVTREESAHRGHQYAAALIQISPEVPTLLTLSAFIFADASRMREFLSSGSAEFAARQEAENRRAVLMESAVISQPALDAPTMPTIPPYLPEPLSFVDPTQEQFEALFASKTSPCNIVDLCDYRFSHGL